MAGEVLVVAEHRDGKLVGTTREAIAFARELASSRPGHSVAVLVIGENADAPTAELVALGGFEVLRASGPHLGRYDPAAWAAAIENVARQRSPFAVVMGQTYQCIDFAPRLSASMGSGLISGCVGFRSEGDATVFVKPVFGARLLQEVVPLGDPPYLVSVQPGAFKPVVEGDGTAGKLVDVRVESSKVEIGRRALEVLGNALGEIDLAKAEIVVAGGRGLGGKENFRLVEELARALGGAVGATRPVIDAGWLPRERQIGISGLTVAPRLYVACAISGAPQHLVGMRSARCVVAINTDPAAPIFSVADYGIVGDVFTILPALIAGARRLLRPDEGE